LEDAVSGAIEQVLEQRGNQYGAFDRHAEITQRIKLAMSDSPNWAFRNGYQEGLSIERNDFNGNYEPNNCRWITMYDQHSNECRNVFIEHNGEIKTIAQWCRDLGFSEITAYARHSKYGAKTFEELFCDHLLNHRVTRRINKCLVCERVSSVKWRKDGKLCNTCYHRGLRWVKKTGGQIEKYHEFDVFE
jgi:hypothetical protein